MKSVRWMVALLVIALLSLGLSGCMPEEKEAAAPAAVEQEVADSAPMVEPSAAPVVEKPTAPVVEKPTEPVVEKPAAPVVEKPAEPAVEHPAKADPAAAKPKDHPAH